MMVETSSIAEGEIDSTELALVEEKALTLIQRANEILVVDQDSFDRADALYNDFLAQEKRINSLFDPIRDARYAAYQRVQKLQKARLDELGPGKKILKAKNLAYIDEQRRIAREAEEYARRERERLERVAREAALAEETRLRKEAEERQLAAAIRAEASGDRDVADALLDLPPLAITIEPLAPVFSPPPAELPKADLRKYGKRWRCRVTDTRAACKAVAEGLVSERIVDWKASELNNLAKSMGGVRKIDGFEFTEE